jgi:nucleoside-diphosphate-sugar epimerase
MAKSVLVIGANGRLGRTLAAAFLAEGWQVLGQVRREPVEGSRPGLRWIQAPLGDPVALAAAAGRADVVIHAANPPYTRWRREALPMALSAIATAQRLNALLMFPGNVYNFGDSMPEVLLEDTPQHPSAHKGRIRVEIESALRDAAKSGLHTVTLRAGDFFGGPGRGSWFDLVVVKSLPKGKVVYPGKTNLVHAWAYLPDLARTFALVAEARGNLAVSEALHFPGHAITGEELVSAIAGSARRLRLLDGAAELKCANLPWGLMRIGGLAVPMLRELAEMRYLWSVPHLLSGERLAKLIGTIPATPLDQALDATLSELFKSSAKSVPAHEAE